MKKVFLLLTVILFMSTTSLNAKTMYAQDCEAYAASAAQAELDTYSLAEGFYQFFSGNMREWYDGYLASCEEINAQGGTALDPVFVNL
jgi:hypothetical protein